MKNSKMIVYAAATLAIFIVLTLVIKKYMTVFVMTLIILFIARPIHNQILKIKLLKNKIAAFISLLLVNLIIFILIYVLGSLLYNLVLLCFNDYSIISLNIDKIINQISFLNKLKLENVESKLSGIYTYFINSGFLQKSAAYTTEIILSYLLSNVIVYFMISDKYTIIGFINKFIDDEKICFMQAKLYEIKNILGIQIILVLISTIITIVGFLIIGINNAFSLGVICGILDILPYIGTAIIFLPIIFYNILIKKYVLAIEVSILFLFIEVTRQMLDAKFMSKNLKIHPLFIIISSYIGIKIFGVVGLFMGPIYILTVKELFIN